GRFYSVVEAPLNCQTSSRRRIGVGESTRWSSGEIRIAIEVVLGKGVQSCKSGGNRSARAGIESRRPHTRYGSCNPCGPSKGTPPIKGAQHPFADAIKPDPKTASDDCLVSRPHQIVQPAGLGSGRVGKRQMGTKVVSIPVVEAGPMIRRSG